MADVEIIENDSIEKIRNSIYATKADIYKLLNIPIVNPDNEVPCCSNLVSTSIPSDQDNSSPQRPDSPKTIHEILNYSERMEYEYAPAISDLSLKNISQLYSNPEQASCSNFENNKINVSVEDSEAISSTFEDENQNLRKNKKVKRTFCQPEGCEFGYLSNKELLVLTSALEYQYKHYYLKAIRRFKTMLKVYDKNHKLQRKKMALFYLQDIYRKYIARKINRGLDLEYEKNELMVVCRERVMLDLSRESSRNQQDMEDRVHNLLLQYETVGRHEDALKICTLVLECFKTPLNERCLCMTYMSIGEAQMGFNNYEVALKNYCEAYTISIENNLNKTSDIAYKLYEFSRHFKMSREALSYMKKYLRCLDKRAGFNSYMNAYNIIFELCMELKIYCLGSNYAKKYRAYCGCGYSPRRVKEMQSANKFVEQFQDLMDKQCNGNVVDDDVDDEMQVIPEYPRPEETLVVAENRNAAISSPNFYISDSSTIDIPNLEVQQGQYILGLHDFNSSTISTIDIPNSEEQQSQDIMELHGDNLDFTSSTISAIIIPNFEEQQSQDVMELHGDNLEFTSSTISTIDIPNSEEKHSQDIMEFNGDNLDFTSSTISTTDIPNSEEQQSQDIMELHGDNLDFTSSTISTTDIPNLQQSQDVLEVYDDNIDLLDFREQDDRNLHHKVMNPISENHSTIEIEEDDNHWKIRAEIFKLNAQIYLLRGERNPAIINFDNYYKIHADNNDVLGKRDACELIMNKFIEFDCFEDAMNYASKWYIECCQLDDYIRADNACKKINFIRRKLNLSELDSDRIFVMHLLNI